VGTERFAPDLQCTGKRRFIDKADAKRSRGRLDQLGHHGLEPYRCPHCAMWHLGNRPPAHITANVREARARDVANGTDR
jgi:hypothetical protein